MRIKEFIKKHRYVLGFSFLLIGLSLFMMLLFQKESDYFWHVKVGEYIVKFKEIPKTCLYSWYAIENNLMFTLHEWLYEVIIYGFYKVFNNFAPLAYLITFLTILTTFLYKTTIKKLLNKNLILFIPFIALITINLALYSLPRPHIISWILVAITIYLSYDLYQNDSNKIYWLPLITVIWGNIHGGSSCLAYMIPGLFMVLGLFNFNKFFIINEKLPKEKIIRYLIIIILNILALCLNPYGYEMVLYPYINILDDTMTTIINEWHPLSIKTSTGIIAFILIFYNLYIYYQGKQKLKLIDFSLFLVFVYLAISSYRFVPLLIIVSFYTTLNYLNYSNKGIKGNSLIVTLITGILLITITQINNVNDKLYNKDLDDELITTIKDLKPERLYNDYNIGGYLIYNEIDVFIDGRADAYSKANLKDAYSLMVGNGPDTQKLLDKYNFDLLITENDRYLEKFLKKNQNYEPIIKDDHYSIYKRISN